MIPSPQQSRLIVLTRADTRLLETLDLPAFAEWEVHPVRSAGEAFLLQQADRREMILAGDVHLRTEGLDSLAWLCKAQAAPIILCADLSWQDVAAAYNKGVSIWIPYEPSLESPMLLTAALNRGRGIVDLHRRHEAAAKSDQDHRRQIDRLVSLLWRTAPMETRYRWFGPRYMLERMQEEIVRARRHGTSLTVALGEIRSQQPLDESFATKILRWAAKEISRHKRRCDVAGQYGIAGMMLLLAQTPPHGGAVCCQRLKAHLERKARECGLPGGLRLYFGLAGLDSPDASPQSLLRKAEEHLHRAVDRDEPVVVG